MIPNPECYDDNSGVSLFPLVDITLWRNQEFIGEIKRKPIHNPYSFILDDDHTNSYEGGDLIQISVNWNWRGQKTSRDYSVVVYAQQPITIIDENGSTN